MPAEKRRQTGSLHFEGLANLHAILASLMRGTADDEKDPRFQELSEATEVVVAGCSAGGVAAALHLERIREMLPKAFVVGLLDSAMFPNWFRRFDESHEALRPGEAPLSQLQNRSSNYTAGERPESIWPLHQQLRIIFEQFGLTAAIPESCLKLHVQTGAWRCFFLEHLLPAIAETTPVFVLQPRFDSSNIRELDWASLESFGNEVA